VLLNVSAVSKSFGIDVILEDVTFRVEARQKVALVGRNGTGKTTLLKIVTGQIEPDSGSVHLARGAKVGYLRQEGSVGPGRTVLEEAQSAQADQLALRRRLEELESRLQAGPTDDELEEYALVHEHFLEAEGYAIDRDARTVLAKMGFDEGDFDKPTAVLSGGEKTRLALARLLLEEPDLLILDEPTNHVDLAATEWLERWIQGYHGAVLLVSHDRAFLENTAQAVVELRDGRTKAYPADFRQYLRLKAEDEARQADLAAKQADQIAKLDEYVRRFMNSQRTAQARGRQKMMERLQAQRVEAPTKDRGMAAGFKAASRSGDTVIEAKALSVGYGENVLVRDLDWTVRNGERWGVIGENGAGKSSLVRTVLGRQAATGGSARLGSNVSLGYFAQDVAEIDPDDTPLDVLVYGCGMDPGPARDLLARFLIVGDDVFRPVRTLSGGEKNKLVLASLTQLHPNLLVLDEPTNHLDMDSREALAEVLAEFDGTLVLVSHDRWLLSHVTDRILDVRRTGVVQFPGGYDDYRAGRSAPVQPPPKAAKAEPAASGPTPRELSKEIARLERLVSELEAEAGREEALLKEIEARLENPAGEDVMSLSLRHTAQRERVESSFSAWAETVDRLEELRTLQGPAGHVPGVSFRQSGP
jgi:ATP-binding cassette, subfamily F, member 3